MFMHYAADDKGGQIPSSLEWKGEKPAVKDPAAAPALPVISDIPPKPGQTDIPEKGTKPNEKA